MKLLSAIRTLPAWRTLVLFAIQTLLSFTAAAAIDDPSVEASLRGLWRSQALAYENGEGVDRDPVLAAELYCKAARLGDAAAQFNLGWMYANGRGVERSDSTAAFFFHAAAEQGWEQAVRMLATVGGPPNYVPDCMREPEPPKPAAPPRVAKLPRPFIAPSKAPPHIVALVKEMAPLYRVDPQLVLAVMEAESNFNPVALSPKNAKGLMQMIPETLERFGVRSPYDPRQSIRGGMQYLRWLLAYFEGDVMLVIAAYNAGEGTVNRYRGVPPYAETRAYVKRILGRVDEFVQPFDASVTEPSPLMKVLRSASR